MTNENKTFKQQEIHTPSAFEGSLWTMVGIKDARTVLHSPPGCYINQHVNAQVNDWFVELATSNLKYSEIMQGGEDQLEQVLHKIAAKRPPAIFVVSSPPVEVAQDDIEGVAEKIDYEPTVVVRPPIGGNAAEGKDAAMTALCDMMDSHCPKTPNSVNLIGPTFSMFNWMADCYELKRMLQAVGITVNTVMTAGATVEEIKKAPGAALNICMYPFDNGVETAKAMQSRFDIPYVADIVPIGFENTSLWLEQIADFFSIDARPYLKTEMETAFEFIRSPMVFTVTFEMSAALSLENHNTYAVGIAEFYSKEVGVKIAMSAVSNPAAATRIEKVTDHVLLSPTLEEKRDQLIATSPMAIFGNFYDKKISMDEGFRNFIFADLPSIGYLNSENCPFMGFMGAKYLVQTLVNEVYMGIFLETKGDMVGTISHGDIDWDLDAETALQKISEMIPHFVRAFAVKKLHQGCEEMAEEAGTSVTLSIVREAADKFTPTKFKAKFSAIFGTEPDRTQAPPSEEALPADEEEDDDYDMEAMMKDAEWEDVPIESLEFTMPWDDDAKQMLELVPPPFRQVAAANTEDYSKDHGSDHVTAALLEAFRIELGM